MEDEGTDIVSVIIPCRCNSGELKQCLERIRMHGIPSEVIVVDSTSDNSISEVVDQFENVRHVLAGADLLPGGARNLGAHHAKGEYFLFIDADCTPEPGWMMSAISALRTGAKISGGPILDKYPWHPIASIDNLMQFVDFPGKRPDGASSYFPGCNIAITRTVFMELGGFPVDVRAGEDVMFSSAAFEKWPMGLRFVHDMRVRHSGRRNFRAFMKHQEYFGFYRGRLGLRLKPLHQQLGQKMLMIFPVIGIRFYYIMSRTVRWNMPGIFRIIVFFPILIIGLAAWAMGFYRGCRTGRTL